MPRTPVSDLEELDAGIEGSEVLRICGHDSLSLSPCADDDVCVGDIRGAARCKQPADIGRVDPVERDDVGLRLSNEPCKPDLALGPADRLCECRCRDRDRRARLVSAGEQHDDTTIPTIKSDESARIERQP